MQIRFVLPLVFIMGFALMACQEQTAQQPGQSKIAVVDVARLMRDSVPGKEGIKFIEAQQTALQEQLDAIQDRLEKNPEDQAAMQELQKVYASSQQRIQAEGQNVANLLFDAVQRVLNSFREKNGYDVIMGADALASYDSKMDVTAAVLAEVDKQKIEFKPLPQPEAASDKAGAEEKETAEQMEQKNGHPEQEEAKKQP